jgi:hypothetical protein
MEQVVKGVTSMVINRSFQFSIFRVAIIAGMAHAVPVKGTTLFLINRNSALFYPLRRPLYSYNHFLLKGNK